MSKLPEDIRAVLLKSARRWVLNHYVGGRKKLEAWSDHYAHLTSIRSFELPGDSAANLRRLVKLAKAGVLTERPRYREKVGTRTFDAPRDEIDRIGAEAVAYWESLGYVVGEMMEITEAQKTERAAAQQGTTP
ncbi:hypothetical protein [Comamonas sp.]|uniref:hypothetical protein n=1 Tax=Comamonas sp. TaxID=34028 RepID=UPI002FCB5374